MTIDIRDPVFDEIPALAALWHQGWHEAHAAILPTALTRLRTLDDFVARLERLFPCMRVCGAPGAPDGFCIVKADELNQMYVGQAARGSGVGPALIADGERRMRQRGVDVAWLACAIGNIRAARFYQKCGWSCEGEVEVNSETSEGDFPVKVWRYEKRLSG